MAQKGTDRFKEVIKAYLDKEAERDEYFALSYENPNKSIDECVDYILTTVKESGCAGFDDPEIYGMAIHYYQEDEPGKITQGLGGQVIVTHHVDLTEEEVAQARQKALDSITQEEIRKHNEKERKEKERAKKAEEERKAKAEAKKQELQNEGVLSLWDE